MSASVTRTEQPVDADYSINLNHVGFAESMQGEAAFEEFSSHARLLLDKKGFYLDEKEMAARCPQNQTIKELMTYSPNYQPAGYGNNAAGERVLLYFDTMLVYEIVHNDPHFDYFFCCALTHVDLFKVDAFLDFHLEHNFKQDEQGYVRFLMILLYKYEKLIARSPYCGELIRQWITRHEQQNANADQRDKIKATLQRKNNDKLTELNQHQVLLFMHHCQLAKVFLPQSTLGDSQAARALELLTGYSYNALRINYGKPNEYMVKENYVKVYKLLNQILLALNQEMKAL